MTAITQNLPWFVRDLGVFVIGDQCYTSLVENLNVGDVYCLKYSLSKAVGIGIVVGGSIMKVPQLMLILSARSARGLSLPAFVLETLSYAISLTYAYRNDFPFTTYGENLFLTLQNVIITLLIIKYPTPSLRRAQDITSRLLIASLFTVASGIALGSIPKDSLSLLQAMTLPLSLSSKLPQIFQNARAQSTGQLSAFAVICQIAGCLARLFTTFTEVGDLLVSAGFGLSLLLNCILGAQLWIFWGKEIPEKALDAGGVSSTAPSEKRKLGHTMQSSISSHPAQQTSGRKWTRKVD